MNGRRTTSLPRRRGRLVSIGAGALVALLGASTPAHAEPTAAEKETARALMADARDLRDRHDLKGALKSFQLADAIMHVPTTGLEVARMQAALGLLVEARETLHKVAGIPEESSDPTPFREARAEADKLDEVLQRRIGAIRFEVRAPANSAEPAVFLDGVVISANLIDVPFRSNPGHHVIVGKLGATEITREVEARETEITTVVLDFTQVRWTVATEHADVGASPANRRETWRTFAYAGFGVGALGVVVGTVTGLLAVSSKKSAEQGCLAGQCPPTTWSDLDRMDRYASVSTASFVVGGLGLACGVTGLVLARPSATTSRISSPVVRLDATHRGVVISGGF